MSNTTHPKPLGTHRALRPLVLALLGAGLLAACAGTGTGTGMREHDSRSFAPATDTAFEAQAGAEKAPEVKF